MNRNKYKRVFGMLAGMLMFLLQSQGQQVTQQDSLRIDGIIREAKGQVDNDPVKAEQSLQPALAFSEARQYGLGLANCHNVLGLIYNRKSEYRKAIEHYNLARTIAGNQHLESLLGAILYNSATVYENLSDYDNAFRATQEALVVKRRINDSLGIARCYRQIAQYLSHSNNYPASIGYFDKAVAILRNLHATQSLAKVLINKGVVLTDAGRYAEALEALHEALGINRSVGDSLNLERIFLNLGFCYDGMQRPDSAEHYYLQALDLSRTLEITSEKVIVLNNLGELCLQQNRLRLAEAYLLEALPEAEAINSIVDLRLIQNNLAELYRRKGDYQKAYEFKEDFIRSSDSLMSQEKMKALEELSVKFETRETEERNLRLQKENDLQKTKLQQRSYLILAIVLFAGLILVIVFLYMRQKRFRLQKEKLDIEQKLLQIQMNPHFIFNSLQAIQGFILTNRQKESAGYLTSFSRLMRLILDNSRHDYIPLDKEIDTLRYYLELQQLRFKEVFSYELNIDPSIDLEFMLVPPMLLQPFIENAIEHGFTELRIKGLLKLGVSMVGEQLLFEVSDNGIGIDASKRHRLQQSQHRSHALDIIRKRIGVINQHLKIPIRLNIEDLSTVSTGGQGTRVRLYIPTIGSAELTFHQST